MRAFALMLLLAACGSDTPNGVLTLKPDSTTIPVGQSVFVYAFFNDGMTDAGAVSATWTADPSGIVTLSDGTANYEKVTGVAPGHVLVTATASGATAKIGFTVQ